MADGGSEISQIDVNHLMGNKMTEQRPKVSISAKDRSTVKHVASENTDLEIAAEGGSQVGGVLVAKKFRWPWVVVLGLLILAGVVGNYLVSQPTEPAAVPAP